MALLIPLPGKCNAKLYSGGFCGSEPTIPGAREIEPRCVTHCGGTVDRSGRYAYENALRRGMASGKARLFKMIPRDTNLETEITLVRTQITEYRELLNRGEMWLSSGIDYGEDGKPKCRMVLVADLLDRSYGILNALVKSQDDMHPAANKGGNLTLTISLPTGTEDLADDIPDSLDADAPKELPASVQTVDAAPVVRDDKFAELDDE